jgi:hypothetical protein
MGSTLKGEYCYAPVPSDPASDSEQCRTITTSLRPDIQSSFHITIITNRYYSRTPSPPHRTPCPSLRTFMPVLRTPNFSVSLTSFYVHRTFHILITTYPSLLLVRHNSVRTPSFSVLHIPTYGIPCTLPYISPYSVSDTLQINCRSSVLTTSCQSIALTPSLCHCVIDPELPRASAITVGQRSVRYLCLCAHCVLGSRTPLTSASAAFILSSDLSRSSPDLSIHCGLRCTTCTRLLYAHPLGLRKSAP